MNFGSLCGLISIFLLVNSLPSTSAFDPTTAISPYLPNITVNTSYELGYTLLGNTNVTGIIEQLLNLTSYYKIYSNTTELKNFTGCLHTQTRNFSGVASCIPTYVGFQQYVNVTHLNSTYNNWIKNINVAINDLYNSTAWSNFLTSIDFFNATECLINQTLYPTTNASCMYTYTNLIDFLNVIHSNRTVLYMNANDFLRQNFGGIISASGAKAFTFSSFSSRISGTVSCLNSMTSDCASTYGITSFTQAGGFDKLKSLATVASTSAGSVTGIPANFFTQLSTSASNLQTTANSVLSTSTTQTKSGAITISYNNFFFFMTLISLFILN